MNPVLRGGRVMLSVNFDIYAVRYLRSSLSVKYGIRTIRYKPTSQCMKFVMFGTYEVRFCAVRYVRDLRVRCLFSNHH